METKPFLMDVIGAIVWGAGAIALFFLEGNLIFATICTVLAIIWTWKSIHDYRFNREIKRFRKLNA